MSQQFLSTEKVSFLVFYYDYQHYYHCQHINAITFTIINNIAIIISELTNNTKLFYKNKSFYVQS